MPAPRPGERAAKADRGEIEAEYLHRQIGVQVDLEIELRLQIADGVKAEAAFDAGDADVGPSAHSRTGLHGGRGDGEIALVRDADEADVEAGADAVERHRNVGRDFLERRVEAARADEEGRVAAEFGAERELAGDRNEGDARIHQLGVERDAQRVEYHRANEIQPQVEQRQIGADQRRQLHDGLAEDDELVGLDQQAEPHRYQTGRAPAQLQHRADDEATGLDRKQRAQGVDDFRRIADRVGREQHRVKRAIADALRQRGRAGGVLHADQATYSSERKTERQLDRRKLAVDQQQQRIAGGRLGADERNRLDADRHQFKFQRAAVIAGGVDEQITAALDDARVERKTYPVGRLELESKTGGAGIHIEQHAEPVNRRLERTEAHTERRRQLDLQLEETAVVGCDAEVDELQLERPGRQRRHRQAGFQAAAVFQAQLAEFVGLGFDREIQRDAFAQDQLEEPVLGLQRCLALARKYADGGRGIAQGERHAEFADAEFRAQFIAAEHQRAVGIDVRQAEIEVEFVVDLHLAGRQYRHEYTDIVAGREAHLEAADTGRRVDRQVECSLDADWRGVAEFQRAAETG